MRRVAIPFILIFGGAVAAQVPASLPASAPTGTEPASPQTAPAESAIPVTQPTTEAAAAAPATTQVAGAAPTTSHAPTTGFATTGPTSGPFASSSPSQESSSYRYPRRNRFGESTTPPTSNYAADTAGMPDLTPKPYPMQYGAVLNRSIFIKGRQYVRDPGAPRTIINPVSGNDPTRSVALAESSLVFNGASDVDGQLVAFVENTGMNRISRYHVGDPVGQGAPGRIAAITLDSIDYQVGTKVTHVTLGQNLYGQETQVLTTQPVAGVSSSTGGAAGPTTGPSSTSGSSGGSDSILERLRRRRMQELGQ
jgi:hypothetical protein